MKYSVYDFINTLCLDYNEYMLEQPKKIDEIGDGWKQISILTDKYSYRKMLNIVKRECQRYDWEYESNKVDKDEDIFEIIVSQWDDSTLTDDFRESHVTKFCKKKFNEDAEDDDLYGYDSDDVLWEEYHDVMREAIYKLTEGLRVLGEIEEMNVPNSKRAGQMWRRIADIQATLRDELA